MSIGMRVARLRAERGETLRQAGSRLGVHHSTLARIESGETNSSFQRTLTRIARGYGVTVEYLVTGSLPAERLEDWWQTLPSLEQLKLLLSPADRIAATLRFLVQQQALTLQQLAEHTAIPMEKLAAMLLPECLHWLGMTGDSDLERAYHTTLRLLGITRKPTSEAPYRQAVHRLAVAFAPHPEAAAAD